MFQKGNKLAKGRKPGSKNKQTVWVLEELKHEGVDYTKVLAGAIRRAAEAQVVPANETLEHAQNRTAAHARAIELINALARLAPHIANRPKEHVGLEGVESLVIRELPPEEKKPE